jgi:purine-binding chemotaxis protein CheW
VTAKIISGEGKTGETQLISFKLGTEEFGVEIESVKEILNVSDITPVPRAPDYLLGMMNLRGAIIPVLDLNLRLKKEKSGVSEKSRILVLNTADELTGVQVDEVSEVLRIDAGAIEPPPQMTHGIDKFFLKGIAKHSQTNRLILLLNLIEVLNIEITSERKLSADSTGPADVKAGTEKKTEEVLLVVFRLGEEEYAMSIASVREILKVDEITAVPNVPDYVRGIQNVRGLILPIIDMRLLVSMENREKSEKSLVQRLMKGHTEWVENLSNAVYQGKPFTKSTDPTHCALARLLEYQRLHDPLFKELYQKIKTPHDNLHHSAVEILNRLKKNKEEAVELFESGTMSDLKTVMGLLQHLEEGLNIRAAREQRILVIEIRRVTLGILVDHVIEVARLPKNIIDTTPAVISSYGKEIKGIAKLDNGSRLIMLLDESQMLTGEEMNAITRIQDEQRKDTEDTAAGKDIRTERQIVVFSVQKEEFGLSIEKVQEIYKPIEITGLPKTPGFIRGVTNLRGTIIPVVDVKERFGITETGDEDNVSRKNRESTINEAERILVSIIKDTVVGLLVDSVNEVIRVPEQNIEDAPTLVRSAIDAEYLEGIAKLDDGQRIILLININEIMSKNEFTKLMELKKQTLQTNFNNHEPESKKTKSGSTEPNIDNNKIEKNTKKENQGNQQIQYREKKIKKE